MADLALLQAVPEPVGWTAVALLVLWLLRGLALKGRNDLNEYKVGGAFANGMDALTARCDAMDAKINRLELDRSRLIAWCIKAIAHFGGCGGCVRREAEREQLVEEFESIVKEVAK